MKCRLCGSPSEPRFTALVRGFHQASFSRCSSCGLLQADDPDWLGSSDDLSESIADTGVLQRNLRLSGLTAAVLRLQGMGHGTMADYGGGYGLFTRLMRDAGFDFRNYERYTPNLVARGFEFQEAQPVEAVTLYEVLEHLVEPRAVLDEVFSDFQPEIVLATTECYELPIDPDWWYLSLETGQHVAFYRRQTLEYIASGYGYSYTGHGAFHVFSRRPFPRVKLLASRVLGRFIPGLLQRPSLTTVDHRAILQGPVLKTPTESGDEVDDHRQTN